LRPSKSMPIATYTARFSTLPSCRIFTISASRNRIGYSGSSGRFIADGSPQFTAQCSDGLYQITQMYPVRAISRQCWKTFNDGVNCPYAAHGSGGDPNSCDYYFDSANGCQAHGMTPYFGGHPAEPQGVVIRTTRPACGASGAIQ
jgi:hypothetical protein